MAEVAADGMGDDVGEEIEIGGTVAGMAGKASAITTH
jgi:hypothetical protein